MSRHEITTSTPTVGGRVRRVLGGGRVRAALSLGIVLGLGSVGTLAAGAIPPPRRPGSSGPPR
ncbi:hypothetical protein GS502_04665 [Rhodococcus hoagii]|nr:hypothetical protein [Prescottella equi]